MALNEQHIIQLGQLLIGHPKSVEILPGGLSAWMNDGDPNSPRPDFPFLHTEGNLGIPQKVLYQLYLFAIPTFVSLKSKEEDLAIHCSAIILLANPAYQTALNFRRRLVEKGKLLPLDELRFSHSILQCCKESVKASILWRYRRWLFSILHPAQTFDQNANVHDPPSSSDEALFSLPTAVLTTELDLIHRACDMYPRNYHAWSHWRHVMQCAFLPQDDDIIAKKAVLQGEYDAMLEWINLHVSDFSAMFYFCWLYRANQDYSMFSTNDKLTPEIQAKSLIQSYPSHEPVWLYLREAISHSPSGRLAEHDIRGWMESCNLSNLDHAKKFFSWAEKFLS